MILTNNDDVALIMITKITMLITMIIVVRVKNVYNDNDTNNYNYNDDEDDDSEIMIQKFSLLFITVSVREI